jgi:hypothetical protein
LAKIEKPVLERLFSVFKKSKGSVVGGTSQHINATSTGVDRGHDFGMKGAIAGKLISASQRASILPEAKHRVVLTDTQYYKQ